MGQDVMIILSFLLSNNDVVEVSICKKCFDNNFTDIVEFYDYFTDYFKRLYGDDIYILESR